MRDKDQIARLIEELLSSFTSLRHTTGSENLDAILTDLKKINNVMIEEVVELANHLQRPPHYPALELIVVKLLHQEQAIAHWANTAGVPPERLAEILITVRAAAAEMIFSIGHRLGKEGHELRACTNCTPDMITDGLKSLLENLPPTDPSIISPN